MPDIYMLSRVPLRDTIDPNRPLICREGARKPAYVPGTPVLLGWPVLMSCPANKHNTKDAGRRRGTQHIQCVCPRARQLHQQYLQERRDRYRRDNPVVKKVMRPRGSVKEPVPKKSVARTDTARDNSLKAAQARKLNAEKHQLDMLMLLSAVPRLRGNEPACTPALLPRDVAPDDFFHEGTGRHDDLVRARAKRVCRTCPIQRTCLEDAMRNRVPFGIFGGLTERERRNPQRVAAELRVIERSGAEA